MCWLCDDRTIHAPVYCDDHARKTLCGALDGIIGETKHDANCAACIIRIETDVWEVVEEIDAGPEAEILMEKLNEMRRSENE